MTDTCQCGHNEKWHTLDGEPTHCWHDDHSCFAFAPTRQVSVTDTIEKGRPMDEARLAELDVNWHESEGAYMVAVIPELIAALREQRRWKSEAMQVMDGLQELGKALGLPLGEQVTGPRAVEAVNALRADLATKTTAVTDTIENVLAEAIAQATYETVGHDLDRYPWAAETANEGHKAKYRKDAARIAPIVAALLAARLPATTDALAKAWDEGYTEGREVGSDEGYHRGYRAIPATPNPYRAGLAHKEDRQ